jgi:molybdopterin-guanine dinucleotide biosynthesis protein A
VEAGDEQTAHCRVCHTLRWEPGADPITISAAILAGGRASRLGGRDKSALTVDGRSILDRQLAVLRGLTSSILIVANDPARFVDTGVPVKADHIAGAGALGGLYTALADAPTELVLVVACDMPFLTHTFLARLIDQAAGVDVALPRDAHGRHPLCAVYARRVAPHLKACIEAGRLRVGSALEGLSVCEIGPEQLAPYDPDGRLLLNVNTPGDYALATGR